MADKITPPQDEMAPRSIFDYIKPRSLTWWSGIALVAAGIGLILTGNSEMGMAAVSAGLAAIGLRAQDGRLEAVLRAIAEKR